MSGQHFAASEVINSKLRGHTQAAEKNDAPAVHAGNLDLTGAHPLKHFGQCFKDPLVEADYLTWRRREAFPAMWLGAFCALVSWAFMVPVTWLMAPVLFEQVGWVIYGIILPLFILAALAGLNELLRPRMLLIVGLSNLSSGLFLVSAGYWLGHSLGAATSAAMLIVLYAPFMRLPPFVAFVCCGPYVALIVVLAVFQIMQGELLEIEALAYVNVPVTGLVTVVLVCGVVEFFLRRSYTREQLIIGQQRSLEQSRHMIRRYVPPAVAEHIIAGNAAAIELPQRRRITVLFSDIVSFTDMADRLDAESLTQILNEYMAAMARIIEKHDGTLNEFAGDGLMALFGAPKELPAEQQVLNAVAAAQEMYASLPALNVAWLKLGIGEAMQIRVGINTGVLSVGSFGSEGRMTYTAIGLQTNVANRIQALCTPGDILLSDASWQLIRDDIHCEARGEIKCKGVHFPVKVYAPT